MIKQTTHKVDITCPYCGKFYRMDEIFILNELAKGNREETYICDVCNKEFKVIADIRYYVGKSKLTLVENDTLVPWENNETNKSEENNEKV